MPHPLESASATNGATDATRVRRSRQSRHPADVQGGRGVVRRAGSVALAGFGCCVRTRAPSVLLGRSVERRDTGGRGNAPAQVRRDPAKFLICVR